MANQYSKEDLIRASFVKDSPAPGQTEQRVTDETTHTKLDSVIGALGGSANTTVNVINIAIPLANTEQNVALPSNTKRFILRSRNRSKLQVAFTSGESSTTFFTVPAGANYEDNNLYQNLTIYFQSNNAGDILELITYI